MAPVTQRTQRLHLETKLKQIFYHQKFLFGFSKPKKLRLRRDSFLSDDTKAKVWVEPAAAHSRARKKSCPAFEAHDLLVNGIFNEWRPEQDRGGYHLVGNFLMGQRVQR